jgi:hypothetical protein
MDHQNGFPGSLTEIPSGWSGAELDLVPGEGFWARIEQIAVKGEMTRGLDAAMRGQSSPRIWLFLHAAGRGELSAAVAMSFARELAFRDQAALLLDCDDRDQALTRWAGRVEAEGWIDLARYGTSVLTSGVPMPFVGRRGYLLGVGSFAPTDVTEQEIDTLLTRLRRQGDDLLLVAPADALGRLWAAAAAIRIFCWDRQTMTDEEAGAIAQGFADAGCPLTAVATFQDSAVEEQLVEEVLSETEASPQESKSALPAEPEAEGPIAPVVEKTEGEPAGDTGPESESLDEAGWRGLPLEEETLSAESGFDAGDGPEPVQEREPEREPVPEREPEPEPGAVPATSRVFWYGALAAVVLIAVIGIYYFKFVRVPSEGHFEKIDITTPSESPTVGDELVSAHGDDTDEMTALTVGADSLTMVPDEQGDREAPPPETGQVGEAAGDTVRSFETAVTETGQDDEVPAEIPAVTPPVFDMSPYLEPVGAKGWALHVYSLPDSAGTAKQVRELDRRGFLSEVRVFDLGEKGRWRRIYLGSFDSRSSALQAMPALLEKLREKWAKPERIQTSAPE